MTMPTRPRDVEGIFVACALALKTTHSPATNASVQSTRTNSLPSLSLNRWPRPAPLCSEVVLNCDVGNGAETGSPVRFAMMLVPPLVDAGDHAEMARVVG